MSFYVDGKINIVQHEATLLGTRIAGNWSLSPFSTVSYTYGADKTFNVPAFFLTDQGTLENVIGEQNFVDVIWGAVQGEFNENPTGKEILADIGINFIPIVGQICDARDIAACLEKLINQGRVTEVMVWVTLLLTAVGCIPYAGDVVKGALKAIIKGADDVALVLVKKVGGDNVVIALRLVTSKLDEAVPEIRKLIQGWAEEAAKKGSPNAAQFFAKMDEMIDAAVREIKGKVDDFGRRVGGGAEESTKEVKAIDIANKNADFNKHLRKLIGPPPEGMIDPQAHHILFKEGNGEAQKALVKEGQELLRKYKIDPIMGKENLVWAPNRIKDQHGIEALRNVVNKLKEVEEAGGDADDIIEMLQKLGNEAARRR